MFIQKVIGSNSGSHSSYITRFLGECIILFLGVGDGCEQSTLRHSLTFSKLLDGPFLVSCDKIA